MDTRKLNLSLVVADRLVAILRDQLERAQTGKDIETGRIGAQMEKLTAAIGQLQEKEEQPLPEPVPNEDEIEETEESEDDPLHD